MSTITELMEEVFSAVSAGLVPLIIPVIGIMLVMKIVYDVLFKEK